MQSKLTKRLRNYRKVVTAARKKNINMRAEEAFTELKEAWRFDYILANHDGEESDHWNLLPHPIGDAAKTLLSFSQILNKESPTFVEKWTKNLIT